MNTTIRMNKHKPMLNWQFIVVSFVLFAIAPAPVIEFSGKVVKITDGDTIDVMFEGKAKRIRLEHIDCPEKNQPYGTVARKYISTLCFGRVVKVKGKKHDRYGRLLATITTGKGVNVNQQLIREGLAWHYVTHSSDKTYRNLEKTAREKRVGLWKEKNPVEPWKWRR